MSSTQSGSITSTVSPPAMPSAAKPFATRYRHRIDVAIRPASFLADDPGRLAAVRGAVGHSTWCSVRESRPSGGMNR